MDEKLREKIDAAVRAAIDAVIAEQPQPAPEDEATEPHRFGQFRIPPDRYISKWRIEES